LPISCGPALDGSTERLGVLSCRVAGVRAGNETLRAPASYLSRIHTIDSGGGGCGRGVPGRAGDRPARAGVLLVFAPSHSVTKVLAFARRWRQS